MDVDVGVNTQAQLVQAWMLLADGKTATARRMFSAAPGVFWARFGLAETVLATDRPAAAATLFAEAELLIRAEPTPRRAPAIARRAVCLARAGEPEYAAYLCDSALAETDDPIAVLWLSCAGVVLWPGSRRPAAARQALAIAEAIDFPRAAQVYYQLGLTCRRSGEVAQAADAFDRAMALLARTRLHPALGRCHLVRALELADEGAVGEAIDHAERAQTLCGIEAMSALADLHRRARRFDEAERLALKAEAKAVTRAQSGAALRVLGLIAADVAGPRAEELLRSAADCYARAGESLEVAETLRLLGLHLAAGDRLAAAVSCLDQACATVLAPRSPRS